MGKMTGNEFLVKALQEEGVEKIFGYPGACVIDIFDEIYKQDQVELILPRHEQGLIHAADGQLDLPLSGMLRNVMLLSVVLS